MFDGTHFPIFPFPHSNIPITPLFSYLDHTVPLKSPHCYLLKYLAPTPHLILPPKDLWRNKVFCVQQAYCNIYWEKTTHMLGVPFGSSTMLCVIYSLLHSHVAQPNLRCECHEYQTSRFKAVSLRSFESCLYGNYFKWSIFTGHIGLEITVQLMKTK